MEVQRVSRQVRLWQPVKSAGLPVRSVVVLWGLGLGDEADAVRKRYAGDQGADGATVVLGRDLEEWVRTQPPHPGAEPIAVDAVWQAMQQQARRRDGHDAALARRVPRPDQLVKRLVALTVVVVLGFLAVAELAQWIGAWTGIGFGLLMIAFGAAARRHLASQPVLRRAVTGFVLGAAIPTAAYLVALAADALI